MFENAVKLPPITENGNTSQDKLRESGTGKFSSLITAKKISGNENNNFIINKSSVFELVQPEELSAMMANKSLIHNNEEETTGDTIDATSTKLLNNNR